jgi:hypothetical protein
MTEPINTVKCANVVAQVTLGFYDARGHRVGEETYLQVEGSAAAARLFYPHGEQLAGLIGACLEQAREKIRARLPPPFSVHEAGGAGDAAVKPDAEPPGGRGAGIGARWRAVEAAPMVLSAGDLVPCIPNG